MKRDIRLEGVCGGGCRLIVHGAAFDLHDYQLVQLAGDVLRQLSSLSPAQLQAAEAAATSMARTGR